MKILFTKISFKKKIIIMKISVQSWDCQFVSSTASQSYIFDIDNTILLYCPLNNLIYIICI